MAMSKRYIPYTPRNHELKETFSPSSLAGVHLRDQEPSDLNAISGEEKHE